MSTHSLLLAEDSPEDAQLILKALQPVIQESMVVLCTDGAITLHQEHADGSTATGTLNAGEYAVNPPGTWPTADVASTATAVFITSGVGTEHRGR